MKIIAGIVFAIYIISIIAVIAAAKKGRNSSRRESEKHGKQTYITYQKVRRF